MRSLTRGEVELIWTIDRSETHHHVYRVREGRLVRVPNYFEVPGWRQETVATETAKLLDCFDRGGALLALAAGSVAGCATLAMMNITPSQVIPVFIMLGVTGGLVNATQTTMYALAANVYPTSIRGTGVGTRLFDAALAIAREAGANALYVSSTPTENTVDFYLARGCVLAREPDPRLLAAESDDIHLICPL